MRTTLNIDDELMRAVKRRAAESGKTVTHLIEEALRDSLMKETGSPETYTLHWPTTRGRLLPGVDLTDRDALFDVMENRR